MLDQLQRARDAQQAAALAAEFDAWLRRSRQEAVTALRDVFFQPETAHAVRLSLAPLVARTQDRQLYNLVLGHFMLKGSLDPVALIQALGHFADPASVPALTSGYGEATWEERAAIVEALSRIPSPETIDFFNQVFHGSLSLSGVPDAVWEARVRRRVGEALSRFLIGS